MVYIIQIEEREIGLDLLQDLAQILRGEVADLTHADATFRVRSAHGVLRVEEKAQADRICQQFNDLGFRCFVLEQLLVPPRPGPLNVEKPDVGEVELAIAAQVRLVTEKTIRTSRIGISVTAAMVSGIPLPTMRTEEEKVEESETRYYLDLFTGKQHWRARPGNTMAVQKALAAVVSPTTYVSSGVRSLMKGEKTLPKFEGEREYDKYVSWLYQLRYARPEES